MFVYVCMYVYVIVDCTHVCLQSTIHVFSSSLPCRSGNYSKSWNLSRPLHTHEELVLAGLNQSYHQTEQKLTMVMTETLRRLGDLEDQN